MAGVPPAAKLSEIIPGLFQNKRFQVSPGVERTTTFARFLPTEYQLEQLFYPEGFVPINFYLVYQVLVEDTYQIYVVSFALKGGYIYGIYFDVVAQAQLETSYLRTARKGVILSPLARFLTSQYLELYVKVGRIPTILGLHTNDPLVASVQYSQGNQYHYGNLETTGLQPGRPETILTGLSKSLKHGCDC